MTYINYYKKDNKDEILYYDELGYELGSDGRKNLTEIKSSIFLGKYISSVMYNSLARYENIDCDQLSDRLYDLFKIERNTEYGEIGVPKTVNRRIKTLIKNSFFESENREFPFVLRKNKKAELYSVYDADREWFFYYFLYEYGICPEDNLIFQKHERLPHFDNNNSCSKKAYSFIVREIIDRIPELNSNTIEEIFAKLFSEYVKNLESVYEEKYGRPLSSLKLPDGMLNFELKNSSISELFASNMENLFNSNNEASDGFNLKNFYQKLIDINIKGYEEKADEKLIDQVIEFSQVKNFKFDKEWYRHLFSRLLNNAIFQQKESLFDEIISKTITKSRNDTHLFLYNVFDLYKADRLFMMFKINRLAYRMKQFLSEDTLNRICNVFHMNYTQTVKLPYTIMAEIFWNRELVSGFLEMDFPDPFFVFESFLMQLFEQSKRENSTVTTSEIQLNYFITIAKSKTEKFINNLNNYFESIDYRDKEIINRYSKKDKTEDDKLEINDDLICQCSLDNKFWVSYYYDLEPLHDYFAYCNDKYKNRDKKRVADYVSFLIDLALPFLPQSIIFE